MKLGRFDIDPVDYAAQGNAILGIRDSGKSYTGTYLAERLLDAGIPFIAFDPIGVWRYLQVGAGNHPGYQVVVAGDNGNLPLSADSAKNIVRAAMQENVPLVIDLYSMQLTKAQWKRIVEESVSLLLYENKSHGLRHIFIEEAAEFVPQRIRPDEGRVYAAIEKLARMGRNASLGYTLINQRSEEVNKAVLELCDCLFLHRQKGRNSLTALSKWFDITDTTNRGEIMKSLPTLEQGSCWLWPAGSDTPGLVKIPKKYTVHPDPKKPEMTATVKVDVSDFVKRMQKSLEKQPKVETKTEPRAREALAPDTSELSAQLSKMTERAAIAERDLAKIRASEAELAGKLAAVRELLLPQYQLMQKVFEAAGSANNGSQVDESAWQIWLDKLTGKQKEMLSIVISRKRITKTQLGLLVGMSAGGGSFNTYLSKLVSLGLVKRENDEIVL